MSDDQQRPRELLPSGEISIKCKDSMYMHVRYIRVSENVQFWCDDANVQDVEVLLFKLAKPGGVLYMKNICVYAYYNKATSKRYMVVENGPLHVQKIELDKNYVHGRNIFRQDLITLTGVDTETQKRMCVHLHIMTEQPEWILHDWKRRLELSEDIKHYSFYNAISGYAPSRKVYLRVERIIAPVPEFMAERENSDYGFLTTLDDNLTNIITNPQIGGDLDDCFVYKYKKENTCYLVVESGLERVEVALPEHYSLILEKHDQSIIGIEGVDENVGPVTVVLMVNNARLRRLKETLELQNVRPQQYEPPLILAQNFATTYYTCNFSTQ